MGGQAPVRGPPARVQDSERGDGRGRARRVRHACVAVHVRAAQHPGARGRGPRRRRRRRWQRRRRGARGASVGDGGKRCAVRRALFVRAWGVGATRAPRRARRRVRGLHGLPHAHREPDHRLGCAAERHPREPRAPVRDRAACGGHRGAQHADDEARGPPGRARCVPAARLPRSARLHGRRGRRRWRGRRRGVRGGNPRCDALHARLPAHAARRDAGARRLALPPPAVRARSRARSPVGRWRRC